MFRKYTVNVGVFSKKRWPSPLQPRSHQRSHLATVSTANSVVNDEQQHVAADAAAHHHRHQASSYSPPIGPFKLHTKSHIPALLAHYAPRLDAAAYRAAAEVFPMRVNDYVLRHLIDWSDVPNDPIFQLVFPQPEMLPRNDLHAIRAALSHQGASRVVLREQAESIRVKLNPHPASQKEENVPMLDGQPVPGMQHKYRETVLFFPTEGQFCHSFCTYCFRWAQFTSVGSDMQFKSASAQSLVGYLARHPQVKDVLFTGGDPMVMSSLVLRRYLEPLIYSPETAHISTIRIGTKSLAFWPYRYTVDPDAAEILRLFSAVVQAGKHLTIQAHFSHPRELSSPAVKEATRLIRMTGANIRCQAPLIRHVNDDADTWTQMWNIQTKLGMIPYYMFVERDTGASAYFSVPLYRAYNIFCTAYARSPGTTRTVRGPSMSASPGKIGILGTETVAGERVFLLKFFQARDPVWIGRVFFAKFDTEATWFDHLKPAFGAPSFFFEEAYREIGLRSSKGSSGQLEHFE